MKSRKIIALDGGQVCWVPCAKIEAAYKNIGAVNSSSAQKLLFGRSRIGSNTWGFLKLACGPLWREALEASVVPPVQLNAMTAKAVEWVALK